MGKVHLQVHPEDKPEGHTRSLGGNDQLLCGGQVAALLDFGIPDADDSMGIHDMHEGGTDELAFPGPITNPKTPRSLLLSFGSGYDGGDVTVEGLDAFGEKVTEVFSANPGGEIEGSKIFKRVESIKRASKGKSEAGVSVGFGRKLGTNQAFSSNELAFLFVEGHPVSAVFDRDNSAVTPEHAPDGEVRFVGFANI